MNRTFMHDIQINNMHDIQHISRNIFRNLHLICIDRTYANVAYIFQYLIEYVYSHVRFHFLLIEMNNIVLYTEIQISENVQVMQPFIR